MTIVDWTVNHRPLVCHCSEDRCHHDDPDEVWVDDDKVITYDDLIEDQATAFAEDVVLEGS